jgi:hypothetical protein
MDGGALRLNDGSVQGPLSLSPPAKPLATSDQKARFRQTTHVDEPVNQLPGSIKRHWTIKGANERDDAQVKIRRKPTIQRDLVASIGFALADRINSNWLFFKDFFSL